VTIIRPVSILLAAQAALLAADPKPAALVIAGAGIAGLAAAEQASRAGQRVVLVDRHSQPGGHSIMASGVMIVNSPLQQGRGIKDSADLLVRDALAWGEDPNIEWVRHYGERSRKEIWEWFTQHGVVYDGVGGGQGNSVPRFHSPRGAVASMVLALYKELLPRPNVEWTLNTDVTGVIVEHGRVTGLEVKNLRSGEPALIHGEKILISTGGFQNNPDLVRRFWPGHLSKPERFLLGSGPDSVGSGMDLVKQAGGRVGRLDRQWNYVPGIPLADDPSGQRGLLVRSGAGILVNQQGKRFTNESGGMRENVKVFLEQKPARAWLVFDSEGIDSMLIVHPVYEAAAARQKALSAPGVVLKAGSLVELARLAGVDADGLQHTLRRYNAGVREGKDEFGRTPLKAIEQGPFHAVPVYPLARKSLGGIQVDMRCRVLSENGKPIEGLYAAGEAAGFGGIHGRSSLEGDFIGMAILMGRIVGREAAANNDDAGESTTCQGCHDIGELISAKRPGYGHFENSHRLVLDGKLSCVQCHAGMLPFDMESHKMNRTAMSSRCANCHLRVRESPRRKQ
jgi:fumarate reductase flavoprotein subunit